MATRKSSRTSAPARPSANKAKSAKSAAASAGRAAGASTPRDARPPRGSTRPGRSRAAARAALAEHIAEEVAQRRERNKAAGPRSPLVRLRTICLAFADAHEVEAWGEPTFRIKNKVFAIHAGPSSHHGGGRTAVWIYSVHVEQDLVIRVRPDRYFKPPYVGPSGWIGAWIDKNPPWSELAVLLEDAYHRRKAK